MYGAGSVQLLPVWLLFIATLAVAVLAVEFGYRAGRRHLAKRGQDKESQVGVMVGALLGLLAFMLVFTFGLAANRFEARRQSQLEEANAISRAFRVADLLADGQRDDARQTLREYLDARLKWASEPGDDVRSTLRNLQNRLWSLAKKVESEPAVTIGAEKFVDAANDILDLHEKRVMAREHSQIPRTIWAVLYVMVTIALAMMGYHNSLGNAVRSPLLIAVAVAFTVVIVLIADLDRPSEGLLRADQQAMLDVRDTIRRSEP